MHAHVLLFFPFVLKCSVRRGARVAGHWHRLFELLFDVVFFHLKKNQQQNGESRRTRVGAELNTTIIITLALTLPFCPFLLQ